MTSKDEPYQSLDQSNLVSLPKALEQRGAHWSRMRARITLFIIFPLLGMWFDWVRVRGTLCTVGLRWVAELPVPIK